VKFEKEIATEDTEITEMKMEADFKSQMADFRLLFVTPDRYPEP
jgi:hypothetical protein